MHSVYVLKSKKDGKLYTGYSKNVTVRLAQHNAGQVSSTKNRKPFELVYTESFQSEQEARTREKYLKSGWGRRLINRRLSE